MDHADPGGDVDVAHPFAEVPVVIAARDAAVRAAGRSRPGTRT
jgi:hypothetical protein